MTVDGPEEPESPEEPLEQAHPYVPPDSRAAECWRRLVERGDAAGRRRLEERVAELDTPAAVRELSFCGCGCGRLSFAEAELEPEPVGPEGDGEALVVLAPEDVAALLAASAACVEAVRYPGRAGRYVAAEGRLRALLQVAASRLRRALGVEPWCYVTASAWPDSAVPSWWTAADVEAVERAEQAARLVATVHAGEVRRKLDATRERLAALLERAAAGGGGDPPTGDGRT